MEYPRPSRANINAYTAMLSYILDHDTFNIHDLLDHVYSEAGTIYIHAARTVKDWIADALDLGYITETRRGEYRVARRDAILRLLTQHHDTGT